MPVYHSRNIRCPTSCRRNQTRSVFKSLSSPGGGGYNELRIEDRKGQEQIFVHAQRDWDENIEHDQKIRVGHERHDTVEANSYSEFKAEEHHTVHGERKVELKADDHLTVGDSQHVSGLTQAASPSAARWHGSMQAARREAARGSRSRCR
ncbi:bacteriophage T4 gp5 trimerisation domain-containing protein [Pseudomonas sp. B111]|uniref:bacteriophage T4 gp5 trimerisation domain-containing protein n=1 Tax=Pseudomonas sp. B111 TaxID=2944252 RepID=UPI003A7F1B89